MGGPRTPGTRAAGRRAVLRAGIAGIAAGALDAACGRLGFGASPTAAAPATLIRVAASDLVPLSAPLAAAWEQSHPRTRLLIQGQYALLPGGGFTESAAGFAHADVAGTEGDGMLIGGFGPYLDLVPLLRQAGFDTSRLLASAVRAFAAEDALLGLPLRCTPFVMMVNTPVLSVVGVRHAQDEPWTWDQVRGAVAAARASPHIPASAPLIGGAFWTDPRIWAAFVLGMGGTLTAGDGSLDLGGAACLRATAALIALATLARWPGTSQPDGVWEVSSSFAGLAAHTLFVLEGDYQPPSTPVQANHPENRFPLLPVDPLIPVYQVDGLSVTVHAAQPALAMELILWLYEPAQQALLMAGGIPPVVADDPSLWALWSRQTPGGHDVAPLYDPAHLVDVLALLPQAGFPALALYAKRLMPALLAAAGRPQGLAGYLAQAQRQITADLAPLAAESRCLLAHDSDCPAP